jgi:hypothetical protein
MKEANYQKLRSLLSDVYIYGNEVLALQESSTSCLVSLLRIMKWFMRASGTCTAIDLIRQLRSLPRKSKDLSQRSS